MKVLFLHPYGKLGGWTHRLSRQRDLMRGRCDLKEVGYYIRDAISRAQIEAIEKTIKDFKPDVLYINGFLIAEACLELHDKIVYDMGSYKIRNILVQGHKLNYSEMQKMSGEELRNKANWTYDAPFFKKEDKVIKSVNEIIIWEGVEADMIEKIHNVKVNRISMLFYDLPKPIPWEKKRDRVMAIAAKWGKRGKNGRLLNDVRLNIDNQIKKGLLGNEYHINSIGHGGNMAESMPHKDLMNELNNSKVLFCPYICGGIGVVNEGLKLGCNVVVGDWYPYRVYTNDEITINSSGRINSRSASMIEKAMEKHYPAKKMPTEEEQMDKIMKVLKSVL